MDPPPEARSNAALAYAIHVYEAVRASGESASYREVRFGPASASAPRAASAEPEAGGSGPARSSTAAIIVDGGTASSDDELAGRGYASGTGLLVRAAVQCGVQDSDSVADGARDVWRGTNWYVFPSRLSDWGSGWTSCDLILEGEEQLVCLVGRLAEIASTVRPLVWEEVQGEDVIYPKWIIPPQAEKDRFIARDLALNALANLARLELERPVFNTIPERTCTEAWVKSVDGSYLAANAEGLYGVTLDGVPRHFQIGPLTDLPITAANAPRFAASRLAINRTTRGWGLGAGGARLLSRAGGGRRARGGGLTPRGSLALDHARLRGPRREERRGTSGGARRS